MNSAYRVCDLAVALAKADSETRLDGLHLARDVEQRRIELHERPLDGGVLRMALAAAGIVGQRLRRILQCIGGAEVEERPSVLELRILHFRLDAAKLRLKAAALVDRSLARRRAELEHERRLVGPLAGLHELAVRRGIHEHVAK